MNHLRRKISHPEWLSDSLKHQASICRLYMGDSIPEILRHELVSNAADRVLRACYPNRWSIVWVMLVKALRGERERIHGIFYRFWRYKIQGKSQADDLHQIMTDICPHCRERCEIPQVGDDRYRCSGCGRESDFCELSDAQPEDEDES